MIAIIISTSVLGEILKHVLQEEGEYSHENSDVNKTSTFHARSQMIPKLCFLNTKMSRKLFKHRFPLLCK